MWNRNYFTYILTNKNRAVLYVGVTNDIRVRVLQHREGTGSKFTKQYNVHRLVYFEHYTNINDAIDREKQIKAGSRADKLRLIQQMNPKWKDLFHQVNDQ